MKYENSKLRLGGNRFCTGLVALILLSGQMVTASESFVFLSSIYLQVILLKFGSLNLYIVILLSQFEPYKTSFIYSLYYIVVRVECFILCNEFDKSMLRSLRVAENCNLFQISKSIFLYQRGIFCWRGMSYYYTIS